jgi:hypothetical protein
MHVLAIAMGWWHYGGNVLMAGDRDIPMNLKGIPYLRFAFAGLDLACVYRNLNPNVLTMKSAQYRARTYDAGSLNRTRDRRILVQ